MSILHQSRQHPEIGSVALRMLWIPAVLVALLASYLALRTPGDEEPLGVQLTADVSADVLQAPDQPNVSPTGTRASTSVPAAVAHDPAIVEHELLDPVGAGRATAP